MSCTPVLLIIFNRPDTTAQVFESIRAYRPNKLYVAADGPRRHKVGESRKCIEARDIVKCVDWPCELETLFRDENLGCRRAVSEALDWFFSMEDSGIVLEDDTVPSESFFDFCGELLKRYVDNDEIMAICGTNAIPETSCSKSSYRYSRVFDPWGWASWRRAWKNYDNDFNDLQAFKRSKELNRLGAGLIDFQGFWMRRFEGSQKGKYDSWAYRWTYSIFKKKGFVVIPNNNLITNVGFGPEATHTIQVGSALANLRRSNIGFPLIHPKSIRIDRSIERRSIVARHQVDPATSVHTIVRDSKRVVRGLLGEKRVKSIKSLRAHLRRMNDR